MSLVIVLIGGYSYTNLFMVSRFIGPFTPMNLRLWYVEVLCWLLVMATAVIAVPALDRLERRWPFSFAFAVVAIALFGRWADLSFKHPFPTVLFTVFAGFFFAFGWAAAKATHAWQRLLISALLLASLYGYFGVGYENLDRTMVVAIFTLLLIWVPRIRIPGLLVPTMTILASASLYIYLVQWQVLEHFVGWPAVLLSLPAGIAVYYVATKTIDYVQPLVTRFSKSRRKELVSA